ncbi:MAG: multiheme c-type cytochrome [Acidobacteriota bacterium]
MHQKSLAILGCSLALLVFAVSHGAPSVAAAPAAPLTPAYQTDGYVGADGCKECHEKYFDAWNNSKHKRALSKLGAADMEGDKCIGCHVTGTPAMIKADGAKPRYPGVQCEMCHGGGAKHVEQARAKAMVKGAIVKTPDEDNCAQCHSEKSPHYKSFVYAGMKGLVHTIKK